jgi:hypothetical protein
LLRLFAGSDDSGEEPAVQFHLGTVEFRALGSDWRFVYAPMAPLSGSIPRTTNEIPDPFLLTRTPLAMPARLIRQREISLGRDLGIGGRASISMRVD